MDARREWSRCRQKVSFYDLLVLCKSKSSSWSWSQSKSGSKTALVLLLPVNGCSVLLSSLLHEMMWGWCEERLSSFDSFSSFFMLSSRLPLFSNWWSEKSTRIKEQKISTSRIRGAENRTLMQGEECQNIGIERRIWKEPRSWQWMEKKRC